MLLIKNIFSSSLFGLVYLFNGGFIPYVFLSLFTFLNNYKYIKKSILDNEYFNQIYGIIILIKYMDIIHKIYLRFILYCFNFMLNYIKQLIMKEVIPTKDFKDKKDIDKFLDSIN